MNSKIIRSNPEAITMQVTIPMSNSMLQTENDIQSALNQAGMQATQHALSIFDTNGAPIEKDGKKYTSKGKVSKKYQTPYGEINLDRHVYQSSQGGSTFCPVDNSARIIIGSTPKFSKQISSKYTEGGSKRVQVDLKENHGRYISRALIQDVSEYVGSHLLEKQTTWKYMLPVKQEDVTCVGISLDGTCMLIVDDGYRQAMVGTISLYNSEGERLYTHYTANAPERGKKTFLSKFESEIKRILELYPSAIPVGIADGAKDNWCFLEKHCECQILDFYHASEYVGLISKLKKRFKDERKKWMEEACHKLRCEEKGAEELLNEFEGLRSDSLSKKKQDDLEKCITYFNNHLHQMDYKSYMDKKYPIGSGVVEAACKVIIKQRLCNSGMKWKERGANAVLCLRCLNYSDMKWEQTWDKINKHGL